MREVFIGVCIGAAIITVCTVLAINDAKSNLIAQGYMSYEGVMYDITKRVEPCGK